MITLTNTFVFGRSAAPSADPKLNARPRRKDACHPLAQHKKRSALCARIADLAGFPEIFPAPFWDI